ncbi:DUF2157 domain-containing protein [Dokdonia sp.]|uniref:DUF2157 domain-containing protein n=1 Tax=Dokdonia sp. TaxID=2024995 RepID=UPI00326376E0
MTKLKREDIHLISRHSNWSEEGVQTTLKKSVYTDVTTWHTFLRLFFISLGIGFTVAGILFFFAYNWADLHKFIKIGLIEGLIIILTIYVVFSKIKPDIKNIILTGTSILVGVLFAVFGQVYQTGANAYDFFLGWTMAITVWAIIANYGPLWLVYLLLINTTIFLYAEQVAQDWSFIFVCTLLFVVNAIPFVAFLLSSKLSKTYQAPIWLLNILVLAMVSFATLGILNAIVDRYNDYYDPFFFVLLFLTIAAYSIGMYYGQKQKNGFYLSVIPLSIIIIIATFMINTTEGDGGVLLLVSLFIIISITFVIKNLINLQKKKTDA